jgi:transposase
MDTHPTLPQDLWDQQQVRCPQGHLSMAWGEHGGGQGSRPIIVEFDKHTCETCPVRPSCTRAKHTGRRLRLPPQDQYEALHEAQTWSASEEGQQLYKRRAGVEGTLSQGVRAFGLRRTRYWGEAKTHLQHVAIAAAINIDRLVAWLNERPRAQTRTSRFAALAPAGAKVLLSFLIRSVQFPTVIDLRTSSATSRWPSSL